MISWSERRRRARKETAWLEGQLTDGVPARGAAIPKPRLWQRYTLGQLALRGGALAMTVYCVALGFVTGWSAALICFLVGQFAIQIYAGGYDYCRTLLIERGGAFWEGRVEAEYRGTERSYSSFPWEQIYVYVGADGKELTYRHGVPRATLAPLPTRRLWPVRGEFPELAPSWEMVVALILLLVVGSLVLAAAVGILVIAPGVMIVASAG